MGDSELKPWEQHGGVICLPRFNYDAPSSLLRLPRHLHHQEREERHKRSYLPPRTACSDDATSNCKRRRTSTDEQTLANSGNRANEDTAGLSLVKLTKSGLLLFTLTKDAPSDVLRPVLDIIHALESQGSASPQWCHRIFPIQATCVLNEPELRATVSKLVLEFVNNKQNNAARPLKFAVGYNRRGVEETASTTTSLLDRNNCFSVVAAALNDVVPDSVVDLKCPQVSVLVELLPVSGLAKGSSVVAVSVLPRNLVSPKPRLCVRPLLSNVKPAKEKQ